MSSLKVAVIGQECVACGCCCALCPRGAIQIHWGIRARVEPAQCIGCGKCAQACPAAVIQIVERGAAE